MFGGDGEHSARAAGGVVDGADDAFLRQDVIVGVEQDVDHELDDFAWGEVVAGLFVGSFVELADEFFEDQAHLVVGNSIRVQVHGGELGNDQEQAVGVLQLGDVIFEAEVLENGAHVGRVAADVFEEVGSDVVGIALEAFEVQLAGVVETLAGSFAEERIGGLVIPLLLRFQHLLFGGLENAVQAAEDGHGEHDLAVLGRAVRAAQGVGDVPDEVDLVAEVIHGLLFSAGSYRESLC